MAERFYLQWNIVNWITVVAMVTIGTVVVGALASLARTYAKGGNVDD
mgnify:CR=1 FL=1